MRRVTKLFNTKATSVDDVSKTVTFTISDDSVDRYGEIVDQKSWNLKSYLKNPLLLWGHDPSEPENVLGTAASINLAKDGHSTTAELSFDTGFNPKAELVFNQVKAGTLRTVSVGFIPHSEEMLEDTPVLKDCELLEISVVPIPANPRAVALALKEGSIHRKDAEWLMDSMRKEADLLESQLKEQSTNGPGEKQMNELRGLVETLTEAVGKLTAAQTASSERFAELAEQLAEATKEPEVPEETTGSSQSRV